MAILCVLRPEGHSAVAVLPVQRARLHGPRPLSEPPSPAEEELDSTGANSDAGKGPGLSDEQLDLEEKTAKKAKMSEGNHPQGSQT